MPRLTAPVKFRPRRWRVYQAVAELEGFESTSAWVKHILEAHVRRARRQLAAEYEETRNAAGVLPGQNDFEQALERLRARR